MDPTTFLIDSDEGRHRIERTPQAPAQTNQLLGGGTVSSEQDHAGELVFFDQQLFLVIEFLALTAD
jgi:hypothetical protein